MYCMGAPVGCLRKLEASRSGTQSLACAARRADRSRERAKTTINKATNDKYNHKHITYNKQTHSNTNRSRERASASSPCPCYP